MLSLGIWHHLYLIFIYHDTAIARIAPRSGIFECCSATLIVRRLMQKIKETCAILSNLFFSWLTFTAQRADLETSGSEYQVTVLKVLASNNKRSLIVDYFFIYHIHSLNRSLEGTSRMPPDRFYWWWENHRRR